MVMSGLYKNIDGKEKLVNILHRKRENGEFLMRSMRDRAINEDV